jgi:hypothetical protein
MRLVGLSPPIFPSSHILTMVLWWLNGGLTIQQNGGFNGIYPLVN